MFIEILFLDHLFQTIHQTKRQLEQEKQRAQDQISRLLSRKTSDQLYAWIINTNLDIPSQLPIGSPHTSPKTQTHIPDTHSLHIAVPKLVCICQHTRSKIDRINHRREFLLQMNGRELHAHVRALFKEMTEEDRNEFLKKGVFKKENCLDISIPSSQCLLCNNSQYLSRFNFCSDQYWLK
jgi:hypothetical protein